MQRIVSLALLVLLCIPLDAQLRTYVTLEAGPHWSLVKVDDPGDYFKSANVKSTIAGLTVEQEVMKNLSVVTGLYYQPYKTGMNMIDDRSQQQRLDSHTALMIPLRVQYRAQPTEYPVSITPRIGYIFSLNSGSGGTSTNSSILTAPDGTTFSYDLVKSPVSSNLHLLEVGLGIGLRFSGLWQASMNLSYLTGVLNDAVASSTLDYNDGQGNDRTAIYDTKGNGLYSTLSFHMPVSNIWQNRDYRIRARIENSVSKGKPLERKGSYYAGIDLGSLWRLYHTSNPAIGARPMEGRVPFRYANFRGGAYAGYMLSDEVGMDVGVNYQRSSTYYALMYDHEVDFEGETGAPMYLEIPLRIRYFYNVYQEKIYAVVYGGLSALVQFSGEGYAGPGGDFDYTPPDPDPPGTATASATGQRVSYVRPVLRLGAGAEYRIPIKFPMFATAYVSYMQGLIGIEEVQITTGLGETPANSALTYNGSGWSFDLGVKIPLSFQGHLDCVLVPTKKTKGKKTKEERDRR